MKNTTFVFYHPHLDIISDRSFRAFLKQASQVLKEVQRLEVAHLIDRSEVTPSELQSLRDRLREPLKHIDAYYLDKIERGSLKVTVAMSAFAIWLFQSTISESIKEGWKQSSMHQDIVSYIKSEDRVDVIDRCVDAALGNFSFDNYIIDSIEKETSPDGSHIVRINLVTQPGLQKYLDENYNSITLDYVLEEVERKLSALDDNSKY